MLNPIKQKALNMILGNPLFLKFINGRIERYAAIQSIEALEKGYQAVVQLNGASEAFSILLQEIRFSQDKKYVSLHGFACSQEWLAHLLEDFVEAREFPVPDFPFKDTLIGLLS